MLQAIEAGADDVREDEEEIEVITTPDSFMAVKEALDKIVVLEEADIVMMPSNTVDISDEAMAVKVLRLIDALEDHDDVQHVYANFSISEEILEKIM